MQINVYDCQTQTEELRDATPEEIAAREADAVADAERKQAIADNLARRAEILERLGLTEDEAKLLLG